MSRDIYKELDIEVYKELPLVPDKKHTTVWDKLGIKDSIDLSKASPMIELSKYEQIVVDRNFYKEKAQILAKENKELKEEAASVAIIYSTATAIIIFIAISLFIFARKFKIVKRNEV